MTNALGRMFRRGDLSPVHFAVATHVRAGPEHTQGAIGIALQTQIEEAFTRRGSRCTIASMSDVRQPSAKSLVFVSSALTLLVTIVRVVGERSGWPPIWFSSSAEIPGGLFGITWLVPVFGVLFGHRLAAGGPRPPFVSGFFVPMFAWCALIAAALFVLHTKDGAALHERMGYLVYAGPLLLLLGLFAWPRAFLVMLLYALLARAPVVAVQYLDVQNGWQTHYGQLPAGMPAMGADERIRWLAILQACFWVPFTVLLGGGFAAIGAATARKA